MIKKINKSNMATLKVYVEIYQLKLKNIIKK